ncbi:alpha/beta fold hydrolase [Vagococcus sp.]|uniref:alpha/beta fold hydrolase n=1 Tax=Vagococcus sp. TaxID=1933889 RepID=UPI000EC308DE|nr:alpha/beta fold hydrolase [Vagococcus sp.]HCT95766.1 hypothetical protein [Vagococcus sp.]
MKLSIKERHIAEIPILEVVAETLLNEPLPLILYYHGWRNNKELVLTQARRLAREGFRVVLPDAMHHGERRVTEISSIPTFTFWSSIQYNLAEYHVLVRYYEERELILDERIGVGGYSMGGITTAALMSQHASIKVGTSIMGTPQPYRYYRYMKDHINARVPYGYPPEMDHLLSWIPHYDLSLQPEKLANRPLLIWHGTDDDRIPYEQAFDFYKTIKTKSYGEQTVFLTGKNEGHLVTIPLMDEITTFFVEHL